ncbi:hypothetical protein SUTMEG_10030 [Sutterella megalosphaeroides]|uniref:Uncharacterized protein n=1 Tax=Sutterella megalosphaeroides TaxID=2494234 RepID=A0A2Z6I9S9_9BURK|nr:hypothetical protein SUTMEG_10030 [Sutterella megalosphaeroides]
MMKMRRLKTALKTRPKNVGMDWYIDKEGEASDETDVAAKRAPCTKKAVIGSKKVRVWRQSAVRAEKGAA